MQHPNAAMTLSELKKSSRHAQAMVLLEKLGRSGPSRNRFFKGNLALTAPGAPDPFGLAAGFPDHEVLAAKQYLLRTPWAELERLGYITNASGDGWFEITEDGWAALTSVDKSLPPSRTAIDALLFLHKDLQGYDHYFREHKLKDAVAAAFKRVENRLNEIRDSSKNASVRSVNGVGLPHKLYDSTDLKFPFPKLGSGDAAKQDAYGKSLKNLLSAGIGWFRNSFDHEPHNMPDMDEASALEHLFVASYMLRIIDQSL